MSPDVSFWGTDPIDRGAAPLRGVRRGERATSLAGPRRAAVDKSARAKSAVVQMATREHLPLTPIQRRVLKRLGDEPQRPVDLCRELKLSSTSMGSALRYLSAKGFARRLSAGGWIKEPGE